MALIVGLTGGIASGKSTVARFFRELGAYVIDADRLAREVLEPGKPGFKEVLEAFGEGYLSSDGSLNRERLAHLVFSDSQARKRLEAIVHPKLLELRQKLVGEIIAKDPHAVIISDAPLLIETGLHTQVDVVVVVWVPREVQIERLMERDGLSRQEAEERLRSQIPLSEKLAFAHYVVDDSRSMEDARQQVKNIFSELQAMAER
jgi:dephospho-CoA kinase